MLFARTYIHVFDSCDKLIGSFPARPTKRRRSSTVDVANLDYTQTSYWTRYILARASQSSGLTSGLFC